MGDLTKLEKLPDGSANVVVSTNTLYLITGQNKIKALEHLCRIVAPDGEFICDAPIGQELEETLAAVKKNFKDVKVIYFVNIFSRAYEKIFEKNGYLGSHPIAGSRPFLALSWLISRLEYITQTIKSLNTCALIICAKKISDKKNNFDVSNLPLISHNIYNLLE